MLIVKGEKRSESFLFLEKVDPIKALWDGETLSFEKASELSGIELNNIRDIETLDVFVNQLLGVSRAAQFGEIQSFYFDLEKQKPSRFLSHVEIIANDYKVSYPAVKALNSNRVLAKLRMAKDQLEVDETNKAIAITKTALEHVMKSLKANMNEAEIEAEYNYILNKNGVETSFDTIVGSGSNGTILHYVDNNDTINDNELVLFDWGVKYNNYCSDISRT